MVSVMFSGAGSVDVSARATLATTYATSGNVIKAAFCRAAILVFSSSEMLGSAIGMNIRSPSLSGGMNSLPMPRASTSAPTKSTAAAVMVTSPMRERAPSTGR